MSDPETTQLIDQLQNAPGGGLIDPPAGTTEIIVYQPEVTWASRNVQPFAPVYVPVDHHARVEIRSQAVGATVTITLMMQYPGGEFQHHRRTYIITSPVAPVVDTIPLREGWAFAVSAHSSGIGLHSLAFVHVGMVRSLHPDEVPHFVWLQDVVNDYSPAYWPAGPRIPFKVGLGITDYQVFSVTTGNAESPPQQFQQPTRRIDIVVLDNPALIRLVTVLGEPRVQFRVDPGSAWNLDGAFSAWTHQSAVLNAPARVQVVGWW